MKISEYSKVVIAIIIGAIIWTVFKVIARPQDPTDLLFYWQIGYPISILLSGIMGILFPERFWQWGIYIIFIQLVMTMFLTEGDWNLLPPGILFYALLTVPCIIAGYIGAWVSGIPGTVYLIIDTKFTIPPKTKK
jgi:hypothetical protein